MHKVHTYGISQDNGDNSGFIDNHISTHLEPLLTTEQLGAALNVKKDTVLHWVSRHRHFPVIKLGRINRYRLSEVLAFFREMRGGRKWQSRD